VVAAAATSLAGATLTNHPAPGRHGQRRAVWAGDSCRANYPQMNDLPASSAKPVAQDRPPPAARPPSPATQRANNETLPCARERRPARQQHLFLDDAIRAAPSAIKPDYAKWMLDDPRVNFAISQRGASNFLELVAASGLFGLRSGAALAKVAGVRSKCR